MLTDTQCRSARPKEKLYRLNDFNGLYLEVKSNGKKAWRYRFKLNGKSSMFALGEYPAVKLAEAREKCEQASRGWSQPGIGSSVRQDPQGQWRILHH